MVQGQGLVEMEADGRGQEMEAPWKEEEQLAERRARENMMYSATGGTLTRWTKSRTTQRGRVMTPRVAKGTQAPNRGDARWSAKPREDKRPGAGATLVSKGCGKKSACATTLESAQLSANLPRRPMATAEETTRSRLAKDASG